VDLNLRLYRSVSPRVDVLQVFAGSVIPCAVDVLPVRDTTPGLALHSTENVGLVPDEYDGPTSVAGLGWRPPYVDYH